MQLHTTEILMSFLIDLILGDPHHRCHPVSVLGALIDRLYHALKKLTLTPALQVLWGLVIWVSLVCGTWAVSYLFVITVKKGLGSGVSGLLVLALAGSFTFGFRSLFKATQRVFRALRVQDIEKARKTLSMIVGRDTDRLNQEAILRATFETLAENLSDSVIAPLFYFLIGGVPLAAVYRTVNTLDAMLGYRDPDHRYIGLVSARADDLFNLIPSRLTAVLLIMAGFVLKLLFKDLKPSKAFRMMYNEAKKHPSPNAGYPEAAVALLLGIKLLGPMTYNGVLYRKPFLNPEGREPAGSDISKVNALVAVSTGLFLIGILMIELSIK